METAKKGFLDSFTTREDRLLVDGLIVTVLAGLALASGVSWILSSTASTQHMYLDTFFWVLAGGPVLVFFLVVLVGTWLRRRKSWFPVLGS